MQSRLCLGYQPPGNLKVLKEGSFNSHHLHDHPFGHLGLDWRSIDEEREINFFFFMFWEQQGAGSGGRAGWLIDWRAPSCDLAGWLGCMREGKT